MSTRQQDLQVPRVAVFFFFPGGRLRPYGGSAPAPVVVAPPVTPVGGWVRGGGRCEKNQVGHEFTNNF